MGAPLTLVTSQLHQKKATFKLEINPNHPVIHDLLLKVKEDKENQCAIDTATTLVQTAMIECGLCHPQFVTKVFRMMSTELAARLASEQRKQRSLEKTCQFL